MWKRCLSMVATGTLMCGLFASGISAAAAEQTAITPEMPKLQLVYDEPPANLGTGNNGDWMNDSWQQEALPLGNGFMGAMVFGDQVSGGALLDRIQINEHTLWSGGPGKNANYSTDIYKNRTKEQVQTALQKLQESLQDKVTQFTKDNQAHYEETGEFLDYPGYYTESSYGSGTQATLEKNLLNQLKGNKNDFGSYQTLSDINIKNSNTAYTDYERGLSLNDATAWVTYKQGGATYRKEYFVSYPGNVMVIRLTADGGTIDRLITLTTVQPQATISAADDTITMEGIPSDHKKTYADDAKLRYAQQVKVIPTGGSVTVEGKGLRVKGANEVLILMSAGTNYVQCMDDSYQYFSAENPLDKVEERIAAAAKKGYSQLQKEHLADYQGLFDRVQLQLCDATLPDKTTDVLLKEYPNADAVNESRYLETLYYQYGRYLLIASSREGSLPANLQGIWADGLTPPWDADYHTNVNLQMNYWLAQQANLDECQEPLNSYINSLVPRGTETAQYYHRKQSGEGAVRGWTDWHENNIWGYTLPAVSEAFYAPEGAAWLCQALWEDYAFTLNKEELAKNFDALLGAAIFWVDTLWEDERDGTLVVSPSYSPEHGTYTLGATFSQAIIWELFTNVGKAAEVLGDDLTEEQTAQVADVATALKKLYIPEVNEETGLYPEWKDMTAFDIKGTDTPDSTSKHRHTNQLAGLHPGTMVVAGRSDEEDAIVTAMKQTLSNRGDGGTGWSKAWKINFWARLRDGDHAGKMVTELLKAQTNGGSTYTNLLDTHAPFQIDGNFGATAGMTEMLLQSQGDSIDLLAALPSMWADGAVSGLKARGNFEVGMEWIGRKLQKATVTALAGGTCVLNYKGLSTAKIVTADGTTVSTTAVDKDTLSFETKAGETYYVVEIDQNVKLANRETFLLANLNNLYSKEVITQVNAPEEIGDNGVVVEEVLEGSIFGTLGVKANDVLTSLNGVALTDVENLLARYEELEDGTRLTLKVWSGDAYTDVSFVKAADNGFFRVPGTIEAENFTERRYEADNRPRIEGDHIGFVDNGTWVRYPNLYFAATPKTISVKASTQYGPVDEPSEQTQYVYVKIAKPGDSFASARQIATITVTGSSWSVYNTHETTDIASVAEGSYDVFLDFSGGINVDSFTIGELEAVDPNAPKAVDLSVTAPTIVSYQQYEELVLDGGSVKVTYSDGSHQTLPLTADMISGFDNTVLGRHTVTVTVEGQTATFTVTVGTFGDVDYSSTVDSSDARAVLQYAVGKIDADMIQIAMADVNGDTKIDSTDARYILQKSVNKIDHFPVEE